MVRFVFPLPGDQRIDLKAELALMVLLLVGMGLFFWVEARWDREREALARAHFEDRVSQTLDRLEGEGFHLDLLARSGAAFLHSSPRGNGWDPFVLNLDLKHQYPYLRSLVYLTSVDQQHFVMSASAPRGPLAKLEGTSIGLQKAEKAAILESLNQDQLRTSPPSPSPLFPGSLRGFWFFLPHYGSHQHIGWISGWVDLQQYLEAALGIQANELHLSLSLAGETFYQSETPTSPALDFLQSRADIILGGQVWHLVLKPSPQFFEAHRLLLGSGHGRWSAALVLGLVGWSLLRLLLYSGFVVRSRRQQLRDTLQAKEQLYSLIAHDLKSPFNSLLTTSSLLMNEGAGLSKEEVQPLYQGLYHTASLAYTLLNNLIQWAQRQEGALVAAPEPLNLWELVEENRQLLEASAARKNIRISNNLSHDLRAWGDRNMVLAVLRNLLSNAVKFTGNSGQVSVDFEVKGNEALVSVSDTGIGIGAPRLAQLRQGEDAGSRPGTEQEVGTGLGLLLCRDFIAQQGGRLEIDSQLGQGSRFAFYLPLSPQA
ncbi:MAG: HAMP domain-containing sensor histidine kinase [bacterium]|nr:HAMP domain-containing sensor histidine kinase [bacterium]